MAAASIACSCSLDCTRLQAAHVFLPVLSTAAERDAFVAALGMALPASALRGARARPRWLAPLVAAEDVRNPPASKKLRALQAAIVNSSSSGADVPWHYFPSELPRARTLTLPQTEP